jgi:V8-like Glu-specific endopeptidase
MHGSDFPRENKRRPLYDVETINGDVDTGHIDSDDVDIVDVESIDFPIIENLNNAIIWPEEVKGGIDLTNTYEINSVPEDPDTPLESVEFLQRKGTIPKY